MEFCFRIAVFNLPKNQRRKNQSITKQRKEKQAGTGPSRRHIQGSKIAKRLPSVKYSFTVLENRNFLKKKFFEKITYSKKWTEWRAGARASRGRRAKVSQCQKTERVDPVRFFNIHSVAKHEKIEENKNFHFREKLSQCRKKLKGGTLWNFSTSILSQNIKKMQGGPFGEKLFFRKKKSRSAEKNKGGVFGLAGYGMLREKTGKTFLVQFARPNSAF